MKRCLFFSALVLLTTVGFCQTTDPFYIPDFYAQSDFLRLSPGVAGGAAGGMFNPAAWGINGTEMEYVWNNLNTKNDPLKSGLLSIDLGGLGFAMQNWNYQDPNDPAARLKMTDYHIGLGGGDRSSRFGVGYSWSKGSLSEQMARDNILSAGFLDRPCRFVSYGAAGHWALKEDDVRGVADVGIRPFGTPLVTVFGDATMRSDQNFKDVLWAGGAAVEPVSGLSVFGKFFYGGAFQMGLSYSVMGVTGSYMPHYDKDNKQTHNSYAVKLGQPKRNLLTDWSMKKKTWVKMKFDNQIKYQRYKLFDTGGYTLMELLDLLETVRQDPKVVGLVITIDENMTGSWEVVWEVREKLMQLRREGKKIVVFFERGDMKQYYLASVGDKIMVDPVTTVGMFGFNMGGTYYRNFLDKIGVGVDEWRFFKYKSAFEAISRTGMSDADREQRQALIDGFYETMKADICASRPEITSEIFDHVVNNICLLTPDSLLFYHLADTTGRPRDLDELIKSVDDGKSKPQLDIKAYSMLQPVEDEWSEPPRVAVIYGLGPCAMDYGLNARRLRGVIKGARENDKIKAVVFRADSPGGDILPSDIVAEELKKTAEKKPVIVSQGMVAGSGGYWISMYGDKIVASPWTITGSIGVIGGWLYNDGLGEKIGFTYDHTQVNKHADLGGGIQIPFVGTLPDRPLTEEEHDFMEKDIRAWYNDFVTKVAAGRKMEKEAVHEIAQGRVWTGAAGKEKGLIDEIGGLETAINIAKDKAGLSKRYIEISEMPELGLIDPSAFMPKVFGLQIWDKSLPETNPEMQYLRMIKDAGGRPLLMMPPEQRVE